MKREFFWSCWLGSEIDSSVLKKDFLINSVGFNPTLIQAADCISLLLLQSIFQSSVSAADSATISLRFWTNYRHTDNNCTLGTRRSNLGSVCPRPTKYAQSLKKASWKKLQKTWERTKKDPRSCWRKDRQRILELLTEPKLFRGLNCAQNCN